MKKLLALVLSLALLSVCACAFAEGTLSICSPNSDGLLSIIPMFEEKTGINTITAEQPMTCVAIGTGKYVEFLAGKKDEEF